MLSLKIPQSLITRIKNTNEAALLDLDLAIEECSYEWVDEHPDTLWTALELVEALKAGKKDYF